MTVKTFRSVFKLTRRSIRSYLGRYLALLLIVLLSVGFFAGLKVTKPAMQQTCGEYLKDQKLYDFRLLSQTGFLSMDVKALSHLDGIGAAEGGMSTDVLASLISEGTEDSTESESADGNLPAASQDEASAAVRSTEANSASDGSGSGYTLRIHSLQTSVNLPRLTAGRMPEKSTECLADSRLFSKDDIGKELKVDPDLSDSAADLLNVNEFTITGLCDSPLYLSTDRGTSTVGAGKLDGFLYVPKRAFIGLVSTEVDLTFDETLPVYSQAYEDLVDQKEEEVKTLLEKQSIKAYVLTRRENSGYLSFENDTAIVSGIANIFPIFFILIGMLVAITTMTRMVEEDRIQTGTLKALGFSPQAVSARYLLYAGSAAFLGWVLGFFLGTLALPQVFWAAYSSVYGFASLPYLFCPSLALLTFVIAMVSILLSTYLSIRTTLMQSPAALIRPGVSKSGKRILLERLTPLWKRFSFLHKITLRNIFRYKQRLFMMLMGISCCAGLVLTGFGVRDSLTDITQLQYDTIQDYQLEVSIEKRKIKKTSTTVQKILSEQYESPDDMVSCSLSRVTLDKSKDSMDSVQLYCYEDGDQFSKFWHLKNDDDLLSLPEKGQAVICKKIAQSLSLSVGDDLVIQPGGMDKIHVKVSGIFENYIDNVLIVNADTMKEEEPDWRPDTLLIKTRDKDSNENRHLSEDEDASLQKRIQNTDGVVSVSSLYSERKTADHALACVHYIIFILILFAGALEFVVIYNLTSINLEERSREIATVEVLGFYPRETDSYVLRENLVLSAAASLIGLPLGFLFHRLVMDQIIVKNMVFDIHIEPLSCLFAVLVTIFFSVCVNLFMRRYIRKIPMAESLKAVE